MSEREPKAIFDERQWKLKWQRVGKELNDEQLSQLPKPDTEKIEPPQAPRRRRLGSFWQDEI